MTNFIATWIAPIIAVLALLALIIVAIKAIVKKNSKSTKTTTDATETTETTETADITVSSEEKFPKLKSTRTIAEEADKKADEALETAKKADEKADEVAGVSKKTAAAVARLTNPDIVSEIEANEQEIADLVNERSTYETIKRAADAQIPGLNKAVTEAQTAENEAKAAYNIAKQVLSAAEAREKLASKKLAELPHNATDDAKTAAQAEVDAAAQAVAEAQAACQEAKYAYEETLETTDPGTGEVVIALCAKDAKAQNVAARDAVVAEAAKAQDEIDRINGKIKRLQDANKELEAKLNA